MQDTARDSASLCERFGITPSEIERRLSMFDITDEDLRNMALVRELVENNIESLTEAFYRHVLQFDELARFFNSEQRLKHLQQSLANHLATLGVNVFQPEYFETRLKVGMIHEQVGILPKWYVSAYARLRALLNRALLERRKEPDMIDEALVSLNKLICLDLQLAQETYYRSAMARIETLMQQLESRQDEIRKLAQTDQLTGLPNRRHFLDLLESEIHRNCRYSRPLCLLLMDIDDFKSVNDRFGHPAGDAVLRSIGRLLPTLVRSTDICGRLGGEELAVALVESDVETAELIAERIRLGILQNEIDDHQRRFSVTVSIGIAECTESITDTSALLRQADAALYEAKARGKNCVCVADRPLQAPRS